MKDLRHDISKKWQMVIILSVIFLVALITQDILREIIVFDQEINKIRDELNRDVHNDVKDNVINTRDDFYSVIDNLDSLLIEHSHRNIESLLYGTTTIVGFQNQLTNLQIEDNIVAATQNYNLLDSNHKYFVYNILGEELYNGNNNEITLVDKMSEVDDLNRNYISDFISQIGENDLNEATVSFYLNENATLIHYVMYGKQVAGTDLIIVNFVNMELFSDMMRQSQIERLNNMYSEQDQYVYVISTSGNILFHRNSEVVDANYQDLHDQIWQQTVTQIIDFSREVNEGYLEYEFYSNYEDNQIKNKQAYIYNIEEWDLIIGSSKDLDSYDSLLDSYTRENNRLVMLVKIPAYIIIFSIATAIFLYLRSNIKVSLLLMKEEEQLYRKFADLTSEIILMTDSQGEIIFTNKLGRKTIFGNRDNTKNVFFDQILIEEEGFYILYGYNEDYYVKYVTEEVLYNNSKAELFIVTDVTEKIKTERKLEALSLNDELTGLGNRRLMGKEYKEIVLPQVKAGKNVYIAMLDLDNFKPANDLYGHSFGDQVLKSIAETFSEKSDNNTLFYRIGGDEFAVLFLEYTKKQVEDFLLNLQSTISLLDYEKEVNVGFSAGVSKIIISSKNRRFSDFYDKADKLLYKSKNEGKNKINF